MDVIDSEWIRARLTGERGEKAALARHLGVTSDIVTKILKGERKVQASEVPLLVTFFGAEDGPFAPAPVENGHSGPPGAALIPVYDVQAMAGQGAVVDEYEAVAHSLAFPPDYLRHITTTSREHLAIISVTGGSMTPTLHHDDIVMVDSTKKNIAYDGMFVVRHDGLLKVKRLAWGPGRTTIILKSDNRVQYPEEEHPATEVEVVGRVVWIGAKQP